MWSGPSTTSNTFPMVREHTGSATPTTTSSTSPVFSHTMLESTSATGGTGRAQNTSLLKPH